MLSQQVQTNTKEIEQIRNKSKHIKNAHYLEQKEFRAGQKPKEFQKTINWGGVAGPPKMNF